MTKSIKTEKIENFSCFFGDKIRVNKLNTMLKSKKGQSFIKAAFILCVVVSLSGFISSPVALAGGFLFAHFLGNPFISFHSKAISWLLKSAIIGLGFGMHITETLATGKEGFSLTLFSIIATLILGFVLGKLLKINKKTAHLVSSGTAICGGSAIAAVASVIKATTKDISISLGVIFLLNSIALLLFPPLGNFFELTQHQFGLWSAISIHDTSSVVGAAHTFGDEALQVATTVKLSRALWIVPISVLSALLFKEKGTSFNVPYFIFFFILAILLNTYLPIPTAITSGITSISKSLLVLTLFLIGAGLSVDNIRSAGWKPMLLGVLLWVFISVITLIAVLKYF